ncbi:hypothetical protein SBY92_000262 [Candida maltosa Xu316]
MSYTFPSKFNPISTNLNLSIVVPDQMEPEVVNEPIYKQFTSKKFKDPLMELLNKSRINIDNYVLKYPTLEEEEEEEDHDHDKENHHHIMGAVKSNILESTPIKKQPFVLQDAFKPKTVKPKKKIDSLACHADNILRMAIDSTIISSNSFTLNSFEDDEDEEFDVNENSLLEALKSKSSRRDLRSKKSATLKFDINADDINSILRK